jgi:hypothetical protein
MRGVLPSGTVIALATNLLTQTSAPTSKATKLSYLIDRLVQFCVVVPGFIRYSEITGPKLDPSSGLC